MPGRLVKYCGYCTRGPRGEARANATSRHATLYVDAKPAAWPLLWRRWCNHGQSVHVRAEGRRHGNVCVPDEVNLVTTARGEPLVGTPTGAR